MHALHASAAHLLARRLPASVTARLALSVYPGLGLFDLAFELEGFCVVRGPDLLWGGNTQRFHPPRDRFDLIIGGPPCQSHSRAGEIVGTAAVDEIPDFVRVWDEAGRPAAIMENVAGALNHPGVPRDWHPARLRDWDCGGETERRRAFWTWPFMVMDPVPRAGAPTYSVMASTAKRGGGQYATDKRFLPGDLPLDEYERLQGVPGITAELVKRGASRALAIHLLGNGVPLAMGRFIARAAREALGVERAAA